MFGSNIYPVTIIVYNPIFATSDVDTENTLVVGLKLKTEESSAVPLEYVAKYVKALQAAIPFWVKAVIVGVIAVAVVK